MNDSRRKIDFCIQTEDGTKELSHSECAREATLVKIIKDQTLDGQLIGVDLLNEGLYFGFDGPAFKFFTQICSIDVLRQALEILYYFK
ncbi:3969_t:CDS:2, partial [Cetraspora pellucida]